MKNIIYLFIIIAIGGCNSNTNQQPKATNAALASMLDEYYNERMHLLPLEATANGDTRFNNLLPADFTNSYRAKLKDFFSVVMSGIDNKHIGVNISIKIKDNTSLSIFNTNSEFK